MAAERYGNYIGCVTDCQSPFVMYPELLKAREDRDELKRLLHRIIYGQHGGYVDLEFGRIDVTMRFSDADLALLESLAPSPSAVEPNEETS